MKLSGFFHCDCGKVHQVAGIGPVTTCTCGRNLWEFIVTAEMKHED